MGPGRPPKPTSIRKLEGNPSKRPFNELEPIPPLALPDMPEHLDGLAAEAWDRMAHVMYSMKLLTVADRDMMEAYCTAYQTWREANEDIRKNGSTMDSYHPNGDLRYSQIRPQVTIANKALEQMMKIAVQFGLTPAARSRLMVLPKDKNKEEGFEDLLA